MANLAIGGNTVSMHGVGAAFGGLHLPTVPGFARTAGEPPKPGHRILRDTMAAVTIMEGQRADTDKIALLHNAHEQGAHHAQHVRQCLIETYWPTVHLPV